MNLSKIILLMVLSIFVASCSSVESTLISENEFGEITKTKVNGVPIIVTVPQKLGFLVTEKKYKITTPIKTDGKGTGTRSQFVVESSVDKTPISLGESKLFSLDTKRPFYGTATGTIELDAEKKYPTKITNVVDDKTLGRVRDGFDKMADENYKKLSEDAGLASSQKELVSQKQFLLIYDPKTQTIYRQSI